MTTINGTPVYPPMTHISPASGGGLSPAQLLGATERLQLQLRAGLISEGDFQRAMGALQAQVMAQSSGTSQTPPSSEAQMLAQMQAAQARQAALSVQAVRLGLPPNASMEQIQRAEVEQARARAMAGANGGAPTSEAQILAQMQAAQARQAALSVQAVRLGLPPNASMEQIQRAEAEQARARAMAGANGGSPMNQSQFEQQINAARARQAAVAAEAMKLGLPPNASLEQIQRARAERARAAAMGDGAQTPREPTRSDYARMLRDLRRTNPREARYIARQLHNIRRDNPGNTFAQNWATLVSQISRRNPQAGLDLKTRMDRVVADAPRPNSASNEARNHLLQLFAALNALYARIAALQQDTLQQQA